jgi:hypothetical protein
MNNILYATAVAFRLMVASPEFDGCDYQPAPNNKIDLQLTDIIVIMKAGGGYHIGDVIYKFKDGGALFYSLGTDEPYKMLGNVSPSTVATATKLLPSFRDDCKQNFPKSKL